MTGEILERERLVFARSVTNITLERCGTDATTRSSTKEVDETHHQKCTTRPQCLQEEKVEKVTTPLAAASTFLRATTSVSSLVKRNAGAP
jgi:hypothetical protein